MDIGEANTSSNKPHASTRQHTEHGANENTGVDSNHILKEIREGNQKLAPQLDSKVLEINKAITNQDKTINGLVMTVTETENHVSMAEDTQCFNSTSRTTAYFKKLTNSKS